MFCSRESSCSEAGQYCEAYRDVFGRAEISGIAHICSDVAHKLCWRRRNCKGYCFYYFNFYAFANQRCWRRHYVFGLSVCRVRSSVHLERLVTYERLEQPWWNLPGIFTTLASLLMTWLDFGGQRSRAQQAIEVAQAFTSTLGC